MIRAIHQNISRYPNVENVSRQSIAGRKTATSRTRVGVSAAAHPVVLGAPIMEQSMLKDRGRKVEITESGDTDIQNNLFRSAKANVLNLDSLIANYHVQSCFHGTIENAEDVDYYKLNTAFLSFAHRPVYITMDAPADNGCRMTLYDREGNQVGVSEPNGEGTQTLKVPCDWSASPAFTLKIEGGQGDREVPYKLTFRQGEIDPEFWAFLDDRKGAQETLPDADLEPGKDTQVLPDLNRIRSEENDARVKELHEKQYEELPEEQRYQGKETAEELLARKKRGGKLSAAEEAYLRIFGNLKDIADVENTLRVRETADRLKEKLSEAGIRFTEGMRITISCDGSVKVSGLSDGENALAEKIIRDEGMAGELKNAYLTLSETINNMSDRQYKIAAYTDDLNRLLSNVSGGEVTVDDIRIVERRQGTVGKFYLEGLPPSLDKLINDPQEGSIFEDYNKMLFSVLEYRKRQQEKPEFHVDLEFGEKGITAK